MIRKSSHIVMALLMAPWGPNCDTECFVGFSRTSNGLTSEFCVQYTYTYTNTNIHRCINTYVHPYEDISMHGYTHK